MGTAELSGASLEKLAGDKSLSVIAVVTQPDKPKGRDLKLQPSAAKRYIPPCSDNLPPRVGTLQAFLPHHFDRKAKAQWPVWLRSLLLFRLHLACHHRRFAVRHSGEL